jgi:hypothetical protein
MWRSKKFIVIALLAAVVVVGSTAGVVLAQTENGDDSQPQTLLERVADILVAKGINVTSEQLQEAFTQARSDIYDEALDSRLKKLVDEGKLTEEEAAQYKAWWQDRPDMEPFQQQLREWQEDRPDMPQLGPGPLGRFGGHDFRGGMKWGGARCF